MSGTTLTLLVSPQGLPSQLGLSWSLSLEPVPTRLVQRVRDGHFVGMQDLLSDNTALTQHFETTFPQCYPPLSGPPVGGIFPFFKTNLERARQYQLKS